jgi:hypothetical protein
MSKIEIEAGYIRRLETKARGLEARLNKRIHELSKDGNQTDWSLYMEMVNLLGYITALTQEKDVPK